jgi:hypothetical protein
MREAGCIHSKVFSEMTKVAVGMTARLIYQEVSHNDLSDLFLINNMNLDCK